MTAGAVISAVQAASIAEQAGLEPGDRLLSINGEVVNDLIELSFALAEQTVELEVAKKNGETVHFHINKTLDESLGFEFESAVFDRVKTCANKCLFCFVDQMPDGLRNSLYVKDDDYRLSFLYGNFVTLTNLTSADFERIRRFHLSPLYVSVHSTNGELRRQMLGNPRAEEILQQLRDLVAAGIELHIQVVLCPGYNDGPELSRTIRDLYELGPEILSLAIVPVGLTRFREHCHPLRTFTPSEASAIVDEIEAWQKKIRRKKGRSFVYLSDEFYLRAGRDIPSEDNYDGYPQLENGIGLVRNFLSEWENDGVCAEVLSRAAVSEKFMLALCGKAFAPVLQKMLAPWAPAVRVEAVENSFFGPAVNVSGLLTFRDIVLHILAQDRKPQEIIIPSTMLRKNESVFLDGRTVEEMERVLNIPVRVVSGAAALRRYLECEEAWQ